MLSVKGVIMANRYLLPVYKDLYGHEFDVSLFEQRMEMQKAVYLLQCMGVPVGNYGFRWYRHGPYSQNLQDDMLYESKQNPVEMTMFLEYAEKIAQLRDVIHAEERGPYSISQWVECLASLHYLRVSLLNFNSSMSETVLELERRKEHLNDRHTNEAAYRLVKDLFA